ncbi:protein phosphatase [Kitasatospora sp. NPDC097643]|uniref:protein-tyrosine phosphatase family protein n=1 Tax=Kitasatospora sp. NPDC097643 TaxID=3157230 RepID=UPI00332CF7C9
MTSRQHDQDGGGGEPQAPWSEIVPRLWMGGHQWTDSAGTPQPAVVGSEFDLVVSLFSQPGHGPDPQVRHLVSEFPDGRLTTEQIRTVQELARTTADAVRDGLTVLVRCQSGYNRSGLVVAQTLIETGLTAAEAVELIRLKRSPWALANPTFEQYLATGLDVAYLLTGLDETAG